MSARPPPAAPAGVDLVGQARQQLAQALAAALPVLSEQLVQFFDQLCAQDGTLAEKYARREAGERFRKLGHAWSQACSAALASAPTTALPARQSASSAAALELLSDECIERRLQASRLALAASERAGSSFEALRLRSQWLQRQELAADDLLRPGTFCQILVDQWQACGLPHEDLLLLTAPLQTALGELLQVQYTALHQLYDAQSVPPAKDLATIRRSPDAAAPTASAPLPLSSPLPLSAPMAPPLQRARQRAQDALQQLRQLLALSGTDTAAPPSAALREALAAPAPLDMPLHAAPSSAFDAIDLDQVAQVLRQHSSRYKQQTAAPGERAAIEIVALMFQSILAEDRIPPSVRVWFARLQLPVLRVALAEPAFFSNLDHPARQLIDRMGACMMGFAGNSMEGSALEAEISRLVQLIEQYPETGQRVFQLAHQEFEAFLATYLTQEQSRARIISLAQQVEQKETLTIQYTIELRRLLKDMPVRDELRDFLFRHWAEVLAFSAVRHGFAHAQTQAFKQAASDLVWAGSAKPTREQRAQLIRSLPQLLQCLREGLTLAGMPASTQTQQLKRLTDTLAEAFIAKTAAIAPQDLESMARRLDHLEDFMAEDGPHESPSEDAALSVRHIETLLGVDIAGLHVLDNTASPVDATLLDWARTLQPGHWFTLDHNGTSAQVQYAWHSPRRQLHLFASLDGQCYLMPLHRLASYLQSGLLLWHDAEGLTLRATRDALSKIEANPERLQA